MSDVTTIDINDYGTSPVTIWMPIPKLISVEQDDSTIMFEVRHVPAVIAALQAAAAEAEVRDE